MSVPIVAYDAKFAPLADAIPLNALPDGFKSVVAEETVTAEGELAAVRAKLNEWAQSIPYHPYQDFGDRVKLLRVQQCHSYWMGFATHFEERSLAAIERPCSGTAGERAKYSISSLDPWRFAMPVGKPFAEASFPDRMVADSRTVTTCTGCAGARQVTCDKCNGAKKARCYGCNGSRQVTCSGCNGSRQVSCSSCNGAGQTRCSNCGGNGQASCSMCFGTGRYPPFSSNGGQCDLCGGMGRRPCYSCSSGWNTCHTCSRSGRLTCSSCRGSGRLTCSPCGGLGEIICGECAGGGKINCRTCGGHGAFEKFVNLQRKLCCQEHWAFVANPRVLNAPPPPRATNAPPPGELGQPAGRVWLEEAEGTLLATATGGQIPATVAATLPFQSAGQAAQHLANISEHNKDAKAQRILHQRLEAQRVTSLEVRYEFNGRPYVIWLHGPASELATDRFPSGLVLGQSILQRSQQIIGDRVCMALGGMALDVPESKIGAARTAYAPALDPHRESMLCLLDDSITGSGASGFVLTDQYFYFLNLVTDQPFRVALTDLRSIIPEFNDPTRTVVAVNGAARLQMKRMTADQRINVIALLTEIANSIHEDTYEPPGDAQIDAARPPSFEQQLESVIFILVQVAQWDSDGISKQENALLEEKARTWAGLLPLSLTKSETKEKLNKVIQQSNEDTEQNTTGHLDGAIANLVRCLKPETHTRLFADIDEVISLHKSTSAGQMEFLAMVFQELPAPISNNLPSEQEQLDAVIFILVQVALWDSDGISNREITLLKGKIRVWSELLSLPLTKPETEEVLTKATQRSSKDASRGITLHLNEALAALGRSLKPETHARLFSDIDAIANLHDGASNGQKDFLAMLAQELPTPISNKPLGDRDQLGSVIFILVQAALWDSDGISEQESALLAEKTRAWARLLSLSLTKSEAEEELNKAIHRSNEDTEQDSTCHLDESIEALVRCLKPETHTRLFADIDTVTSLHESASVGQMEFLEMLLKELPAPILNKPTIEQEQLEAVAYMLHQAALWDLGGVSEQELAQLKKCLLAWVDVLAVSLQYNEIEELLDRVDRRAREDSDETGVRWLDQSFETLRKTLTSETHERLLNDLNVIATQHGELEEGQKNFLDSVIAELPVPTT